MPASKIIIRPGIDKVSTPLLNEGGWSSCNLIRFFQNKVQKIGGWAKFIGTALHGVCRGIFAWEDLNGQGYIACGTNGTLEVAYQTTLYDITPQLSTVNLSDPFTTISGTNTLTVHSVAHGEIAGDVINIITETSINGKLLIGYQDVASVTDADHFIISTPSTFSASVSGATTALYTTTNTSPVITVTLVNHGRTSGTYYTVNVSTTVATVVLVGNYLITSIIDADNFTFTAGSNANANASGRENGGNIRIEYLFHAGLVSSTFSGGYGVGAYGLGSYGIGVASSTITPLRQWFFGNWGSFLIANFTNGGIYVWDPASGVTNNPATIIGSAPTANSMFIAMPERQVVALGAASDPLLIKWSDVDDYTQWTAAITNQAGSYRLPRGSKIIGGLQAPQMGLIWTDLDLWAMQYIQPPLIYGFTQIASGCGLISARAMGILGGKIYWMSLNNFFEYDGAVNPILCTVWDQVFYHLNESQFDKITCAVNSAFNEISWFYPSDTGNGEVDSYVKFNANENVWDYGSLVRTAWMDKSVIINAAGVDANGYIQQHEVGNDDDTNPMDSFAQSGWFKISDGMYYLFIERMIPDFVLSSGATIIITISTVDYPNDTPRTKSFSITSATEYIIVRMRGRLASIKVESNDLGSFWRCGEILQIGSQSGRR